MNEIQPPFPDLLNCSVVGNQCALRGCWYDAMIAKINATDDLGVEEKAELIKQYEQQAREGHCKKYLGMA